MTRSRPYRELLKIAVLIALLPFRTTSAQERPEKEFRLSFLSDLAYSFNAYPFDYVAVRTSPSGIARFYSGGRISGGMGLRAEFNFRCRIYMMISGMIIDKGYRVIYEWTGDNGEYFRQGDRYREFYASMPCEIVFRLNRKPNSVYLKGGIALDTRLERAPGYTGFASGCVFGAGRSFVLNGVLRVSVEPTFRYGLCDYGRFNWYFEDQHDQYRPVSFGIGIVLTQMESSE